jgi:hypothetical protein
VEDMGRSSTCRYGLCNFLLCWYCGSLMEQVS